MEVKRESFWTIKIKEQSRNVLPRMAVEYPRSFLSFIPNMSLVQLIQVTMRDSKFGIGALVTIGTYTLLQLNVPVPLFFRIGRFKNMWIF